MYVWLGRFRGVRGLRVEILIGESVDSESVDDGDEDEWVVLVEDEECWDLTISRSMLYVLPPPPLKHEDISEIPEFKTELE